MSSGRKWVQLFASFGANLGLMAQGHCVPLSAYMLPQLVPELEDTLVLSEDQGSWFASIYVVGCLTGALVGSLQSDTLGRRLSMIVDCCLMILGLVTIFLAPSISLLLLGRFLIGHASGSNMVSIQVFVSEICHPNIRNVTGMLTTASYTLGFFLSMLLGAAMPWRLAVASFTITPLLSIFILAFSKESPTWLLRHKSRELALDSLFFYRGDLDTAEKELKERENAAEANQTSSGNWKRFLSRATSREFLKPFLIVNMPITIGLEWAGFPALGYYMHSLLKKMNLPVNEYWVAVGLTAYRCVLAICISFVMYRAPRRPVYLGAGCLILIGSGSLALSPWLVSFTPYAPLLSIIMMYSGFGLGYCSIPMMMQGELLPADMRSFGSGMLGFVDNLSQFLSVKMVPLLISSIGLSGAFTIYSGFVVLNLITMFFFMPETKGLSLEDIENLYRKGENKHSICLS